MKNPFPPTHLALENPNGLLAEGGSLNPSTLIKAYAQGIFPWFSEGQNTLWWTPNPRMVLIPGSVHVSRTSKKKMRQNNWRIRYDEDFSTVISQCAKNKRDQNASTTWITSKMEDAYVGLHKLGIAHSIEVIEDGIMIGGLYGLLLGKVFFGESMFSLKSNASKFAFIALDQLCVAGNIELIDCQVHNDHLESMGAKSISRKDFEDILRGAINPSMESIMRNPCSLIPSEAKPFDMRLGCKGATEIGSLL